VIVALPLAVQARVKAEVPALHARVELAGDLAAVFEKNVLPHQLPAGFVLWSGDRPRPNTGATWVNQEVNSIASLVLVGRAAGELVGGKASADIGAIGDDAVKALVGWQPDGMDAPLEYAGGDLVGIRSGALFIQLKFATRWNLRAV
jgi:hypothetical protein